MVARSALGMTFNAVYGPTPAAQAIAECEALIAGDFADRQVQNLIICKVAQLHAMVGDYEKARMNVKSARAVLRDLGQAVRAASSSLDVAIVELLAGDAAAAEREIRPDCEMLQGIGETYFLSSMAITLARAVLAQGRDEDALTWIEAAEGLAAEDDIDAQSESRCVRALVLARKGSLVEAEALVRKGVELAAQLETPALKGSSLSDLAAVLLHAKRPDEARQALAEAIAVYAAKGDTSSVARAATEEYIVLSAPAIAPSPRPPLSSSQRV
jgi:tetratricopeptide (TPR) repeat protein